MITYNNKDILKSFIGNKRVIKKYLNNKIVYGIPDFAQYYNIQGYDNYKVVGNPTIVDGVASGFTTTDYITTQSAPQDTDVRNYELFTKIRINSIPTSTEFIMCYEAGTREGISIINGGRIRFQISRVPGTSGEPYILSSACAAGDEVLIHTYYKGNNIWVLEISKDNGATWETNTLTVTKKLSEMNTSRVITIGGSPFYSAAYKSPFTTGSIDLNRTYIKANGKYWFNGNSNYKELLDCNPNVYLKNNSNWDAYIDTGIIPSNNVKFEISAQLIDTTVKDGALLGCRKSSAVTTSNFLLWYNNLVTGYGAFNYGATYKNNWSPGISDPYQKQTYLYNGNNVYINDVLQTDGYDANKSAFNTDLTIYLFGYRADNILQARTFRGRIYNFKFWDRDTLIQHLVPVPEGLQIGIYKVPSNGMFDIVTQTFYENKGSGEFIWGVDL